MLQVENISVVFGGLRAVDGLTFDLKPNDLLALIGPNGAGKTTVFNAIMGIYPPDEGRIVCDGRDLKGLATHDVARLGISRTFQNIRLFKQMTVLDNVKCALTKNYPYTIFEAFLRLPRCRRIEREIDDKAMDILKYFDLTDAAQWKASNLPYGRQKHVEIARAYATSPKYLLLDEPAAGLNDRETHELLGKVYRLLSDKVGILLIEHNMTFVMNIAQRIIVLDYGKPIAEGTPAEIKSNPRVIEAYLGKEEEVA